MFRKLSLLGKFEWLAMHTTNEKNIENFLTLAIRNKGAE